MPAKTYSIEAQRAICVLLQRQTELIRKLSEPDQGRHVRNIADELHHVNLTLRKAFEITPQLRRSKITRWLLDEIEQRTQPEPEPAPPTATEDQKRQALTCLLLGVFGVMGALNPKSPTAARTASQEDAEQRLIDDTARRLLENLDIDL